MLAADDTYGGEDLGALEAKRLGAVNARAEPPMGFMAAPVGVIAASPAMLSNLDPLEVESASSESGLSVVNDDPNFEHNGIKSTGALETIELKKAHSVQVKEGNTKLDDAVSGDDVDNRYPVVEDRYPVVGDQYPVVNGDYTPHSSPQPSLLAPRPIVPSPVWTPPPQPYNPWPEDVRGLCERVSVSYNLIIIV